MFSFNDYWYTTLIIFVMGSDVHVFSGVTEGSSSGANL